MTMITLEQGTPLWLEWRKDKITSTDAPVLLGFTNYSTIERLWKEKSSETLVSIKDNKAMRQGRDLEPVARKMLEAVLDMALPPATIASNEIEWAASSLDCWNPEFRVGGELKCPSNIDIHDLAVGKSVPLHFMPQIQWQMFCAEVDEWYYASFHEKHPTTPFVYFVVKRDEGMIEEIKEKGKYLLWCVKEKINPVDEEWIDDHVRHQKIEELEAALEQIKFWEEYAKVRKNELISTFQDKERARGGNLIFKKIEQEGRIKTKEAEKAGIDLSAFRGAPSVFWRIDRVS